MSDERWNLRWARLCGQESLAGESEGRLAWSSRPDGGRREDEEEEKKAGRGCCGRLRERGCTAAADGASRREATRRSGRTPCLVGRMAMGAIRLCVVAMEVQKIN